MKSNWKLALGLVSALAVGTAALWWTQQQQAAVGSAGPAANASGRAGADAQAGPNDPSPTVQLAEAWTAVAPMAAPTMTAEEFQLGGPMKEFRVNTVADAPKALGMAVEANGGPKALDPLKRATWRVFVGGGMQWSGQLVADSAGSALLKDDNSGQEIGWHAGTCWLARNGVVVPCHRSASAFVYSMMWLHRISTVQSLAAAPWRPQSVSQTQANNQLVNSLHMGGGPDGQVAVLFLDLRSRRIVGADLRVTESTQQATNNDSAMARGEIWLENLRPFGSAVLAATARVTVDTEMLQAKELLVSVLSVQSGEHGGLQVPVKVPAFTVGVPLKLTSRPAGLGLVFEIGQHAKFEPRLMEVLKGFNSFWMESQFDIVEAFGPLGTPADSAIQAWLMPLSHTAMAMPGLEVHTKPLAAELAVARKVVQVQLEQLPAALAAFLSEVEKAGHIPAPDHRSTARLLAVDGSHAELAIVELDVPILPKP